MSDSSNDSGMAKSQTEGSQQITVRVDGRLIDRAERLIDFVTEETGRTSTRADVFREAMLRGLRALEHQRDKSK